MRDDVSDGVCDQKTDQGAGNRDAKALYDRFESAGLKEGLSARTAEKVCKVFKGKLARVPIRESVVENDEQGSDHKHEQEDRIRDRKQLS